VRPSTALTCGRRASATPIEAGLTSVSTTVTSPRSTRLNWVSISTAIESRQKAPVITIAMATAMPTIVRPVRTRRRSMVRKIMRIAGDNQCRRPSRSASIGRYTPGAGGRMASAGASRTVAWIACQVASTAASSATPTAVNTSAGRTR
jgi:hypothetical protein